MTFSPVSRTTRLSVLGLSLALALGLSACGASKPKPAPLESLSNATRLAPAWSVRVGEVAPTFALAVSADAVAVANVDGSIVSLDLQTGRERWRAQAKTELSAAVGSDGRYAAVVSANNDLMLFDQGKLLWTERQPGRVLTAPVVAGERVFVQALDRSVRAYDALDGRYLWLYQRPGAEPLALATRSVIEAFRDTLLVGQGNRMVGLDPVKGTPRFDVSVGTPRGTNEVERLADLVGPLARVDDEACVRAFQFSVACLELNRGSVRWSRPQAGTQAVAANLQLVVGADSTDRLSAWKVENGDSVWRIDRFVNRGLSAPALWGDRIAVADAQGYLHILSQADGRTLTRTELDAPVAGAPLVVQGKLLLVTRKGTVYAFSGN
ncbi:Beta-barrel assembly machine subunit BamB [Aquabacterium commune]|uniref:Outer membrane protein assembly factor BamB n=1 Tax=Aquabacterium commune TaxID=70586 RepID=A0A4R6RG44_9BURK|nr:PQQ-binding-like beta-propeller repeat protein [Aquabacterium commune]TDP84636.1 Beta-barrel assembly machine subunit BamB [Aquabacterium commune]